MKRVGQLAHAFTLSATLVSVGLVVGRTLFVPAQPKSVVQTFDFSEQVILPGWTLAASHMISDTIDHPTFYIAGQTYNYTQGGLELDIEMRYLIQPNAELFSLIELYSEHLNLDEIEITIQQIHNSGSYILFDDLNRAYLSSCINPHGGSTVTDREFKRNRNVYDIRYRFWPWLLGDSLKDERCLWSHLSTPIQENQINAAYQVLEDVWPSWHDWWQSNFPSRF